MSLSVAIITKNEEANLRRTLESVKWADEIVVVDSGSTDRTCDIAREYGAKVFVEDWKGFAKQKNSAIEKCTSDWILSLDADEEVSTGLGAQVKGLVAAIEDPRATGYEEHGLDVPFWGPEPLDRPVGFLIPRQNFFLGKWMRFGGYYPDRKFRLIRKGCGAFEDRKVHEDIKLNQYEWFHGWNLKSTKPLIHHAYPTLSGYIEHMNRYSDLGAQMVIDKSTGERGASAESREQSARAKSLATEPSNQRHRYSDLGAKMVVEKGKVGFSVTNIVLRPIATFIYNYFFRLGFLDGREGLLLHLYHSVYVSWKYAKAWELSRKTQTKA